MITIITLIAICSVIFNIYLVKKLRKRDGEIAQGEKAFKELLGTHKASLKNNFDKVFDTTSYDEDFEFIKQEEEEVLKDKLNASLKKVPEPYQTVLREKYYDGMSGKEIANKYSVPVQIIKNGLFRGRFFLKNLMKDPDFKTPQGVEKNNYLLVALNKYNKENE